MVTKACPGNLYMARSVANEMGLGARRYPEENYHRMPYPPWRDYAARFQACEATLRAAGLRVIAVSESKAHADQLQLLSCFKDEELVELGEAESITLAAYRDLTFYSDERKAKRLADELAVGACACPRAGERRPPYAVQVHTSAWILLEAGKESKADMQRAEALFDEMRLVWPRHPGVGLAELRRRPRGYW